MATDVVARLKLRAESFSREVRKAFDDVPNEADRAGREAGKRLGSGLGAGLKAGIAGLAVGTIVQEVAQLTMRAVDFGVELGNNARALNTNVEELQAYREAANEVGIVNKVMDDGLNELFKSMTEAAQGGKDQAAAFRALGVSLIDANGHARTTTAVMGDVIDKLDAIPDPLRQAQLGTEIFGDKWRDMAPLLDAGSDGLQKLTGDILATGDALSTKEIQELNRINAEFEKLQNELERDVSRAVVANADAIVTLGRAISLMAGEAVTALAAVVNLYRGLNANGTYAGSNAAAEENKRIRAANRGEEAYDPDSWASVWGIRSNTATRGALRQRDPRRADSGYYRVALPKGGRGGGRSYGADRISDGPAGGSFTPNLDSITIPNLGSTSGGGKPRKSGGAGGMSKEAREAEQAAKRLRAEYDRIGDSLDRDIEKQRVAAEVEALRAAGLDREAEKHEAINEIAARYPKLVGKTAEQLAKEFGITIDEARARLKQIDDLRLNALLEIDIKYDKKAAEAAAKSIASGLKKAGEAAGELAKKYREQQAELARRNFEDLSSFYFDLFDGNTRNIWDNFKRLGLNALAELAANQTMKLLNGGKVDIGGSLKELFSAQKGDLIGGMSKGMLASSIAGAIGIQQSKTGSMVGGLLGSTGLASKLLGSTLGPFGGAIGGLLGGVIGGLFKKAPKGSAVITSADEGGFTVNGNKAGVRQDLTGAASSVQDGLRRVADMLNADLGAFRVSIGEYKGWYRVSGSGSTSVGDKKYPKRAGSDLLYDGQDAQEAMRVAILNAIQDGAIQGISQAAQNILKKGKDIEGAVEKALMIEELPKALKARLDPLGAELDAIDAKFTKLADVLREGGASAEQIAQARQLWELERADAVAQIGQASATLRDYLKTLRIGSDSPLSLRTQAAEAEAAMAPYIAQIRAAEEAKAKYDQLVAGGGSAADVKAAKDAAAAAAAAIDQSGFRDSAALFLDVSRALGGSTKSFFDQFDRIQGLTNSAIALVENAVPLRGDAKDPFAELTAKATQSMANILDGHTALLQQIANGIGGGGYGGGGAFIGGGRNFVRSL